LACLLSSPTPTPAIYTLSLHDALPIYEITVPELRIEGRLQSAVPVAFHLDDDAYPLFGPRDDRIHVDVGHLCGSLPEPRSNSNLDRKSTRLNSSHVKISYAVFCLKKKT